MENSHKEKMEEILHFWFEEVTDEQKYVRDDSFDELIRRKYKDIYFDIVKSRAKDWVKTPEGSLAAIIVLDQFSRNMFRESKQSFAEDVLALKIAEDMVNSGYDKKIALKRRGAIYMPYMHSESREVHGRALQIFENYSKETGNTSSLEYEIKHKEIIDRFGRYPHRNNILGRRFASGEEEFNKKHGGF